MTIHDRRTPQLAEEHAHYGVLMNLRARAESEIERLIELLDAIDGDTDFEPCGDDEPALGWGDNRSQLRLHTETHDGEVEPSLGWGDGRNQTRLTTAADDGDVEPTLGWGELVWGQERLHTQRQDGESEPSLGWNTSGHGSQVQLHTLRVDGELEDGTDAENDKSDDEPVLGASNPDPDNPATMDQRLWSESCSNHPFDTGIADLEGLEEQKGLSPRPYGFGMENPVLKAGRDAERELEALLRKKRGQLPARGECLRLIGPGVLHVAGGGWI